MYEPAKQMSLAKQFHRGEHPIHGGVWAVLYAGGQE